jgi:DNA polymerase-3 subunit epsilon
LFFDVETTGLHGSDRIVSLGIVQLEIAPLASNQFVFDSAHLIFDPGKKSHPKAKEVHGWSDWALRHQDKFETHCAAIAHYFKSAELIVAHNLDFDRRFIENEFALAGSALTSKPGFCTMRAWRERIGGRAGLDAVLKQIGMRRSGNNHGALEDAWLAMRVFLWLNELPQPPDQGIPNSEPTNLRPVPQQPPGPLPRRTRNARGKTPPDAQVAPPNTTAESSARMPIVSNHQRQLASATRPIATLLVSVLRADGHIDGAEIAVISEFVTSEASRMGMPNDAELEREVAAELFVAEPTGETIDDAVAVIVRDSEMKSRLKKWLREVTYAGGTASDDERAALYRIRDAIIRAK